MEASLRLCIEKWKTEEEIPKILTLVVFLFSFFSFSLQMFCNEYAFLFFLNDFIYFIFRQGKGGERQAQKYLCVVVSSMPPAGDLDYNPGMCPDWELNR